MKKTLKLLPLLLVLVGLRPLTQTDYVLNNSNLNLGAVTVIWSGGSGNVNVTGYGSYSITADGDVTGVTIDGTTIMAPNHGPVSVAGTVVNVSWPALNEVEVTTTRGTNRPSR